MEIWLSLTQCAYRETIEVPAEPAASLHLAALHRDVDAVAAVVAVDQAYLGSGNPIDQLGMDRVRGRQPAGAHDDFRLADVIHGAERRCVPRHTDRDLVVEAAEPGELQRVDHRCGLTVQRIETDVADSDADRSPVGGGHVVDVVHRLPPAARRHIAIDDHRIARNVPAHVPSEQAAVLVVAAASRRPDIHVDLLALVELRGGLRPGRAAAEHAGEREHDLHASLGHEHPPWRIESDRPLIRVRPFSPARPAPVSAIPSEARTGPA